jgi:tyrosine-protein kinase Etk/Wzc
VIEEQHEDQHSLVEVWGMVRRRRLLIATVVLTTMAAVVAGILLITPLYESSATLHVKQEKPGLLGGDLFSQGVSALSTKEEVNTLIAILESRAVLEQVIAELGLVRRNGTDTALDAPERLQQALERLRKGLSVRHVVNTRLITVSYRSSDPELARKVANTVSRVFIQRNVEARRGEANAVLAFVADQVDQVSERLARAEQELLEYKRAEGIGVLDAEARAKVDVLAGLEGSLQEVTVQREVLRTRIAALLTQMGASGLDPIPTEYSAAVAALRDRLTEAQMALARARATVPENASRISELEGQIDLLEEEIQRETARSLGLGPSVAVGSAMQMQLAEYRSQDAVLDARERAIGNLIRASEQEIGRLPAREINLFRLERARRINDELYAALVRARNEAQIEAASQIGNIEVIDSAATPLEPVRPRKTESLAVGLVLSLFLAGGLAFFVERLDNSVKSEDEVRSLLSVPVLGFIPRFEPQSRLRTSAARMNGGPESFPLIVRDRPGSFVAEAFRLLRANLHFVDVDRMVTCLEVTSPLAGEGKTTVAANLSMVLAAQGERVAIIDADLRVPALHRIFRLPNNSGVTNVLTEGLDFRTVVQRIEGTENLDILTCGPLPPLSSELLSSSRMRQLVKELRDAYDRVIFDVAPVLAATDAVGLASWMDGVLLVLRVGESDKRAIRRAADILHVAGIPVVGDVLNSVDGGGTYGYGGDYYKVAGDRHRSG